MARRHPNVINADEVEPSTTAKGSHHYIARRLGPAAGNKQLGATLTELPPGKRSYPMHYHCLNEEALYVISGTGVARIGDARIDVRAGDWVAMPAGPDHAHQMINTGDVPLVYLALSTSHPVDVVGYPESNKVAAFAVGAPGKPWVRQINRLGESLDYWAGEPEANDA